MLCDDVCVCVLVCNVVVSDMCGEVMSGMCGDVVSDVDVIVLCYYGMLIDCSVHMWHGFVWWVSWKVNWYCLIHMVWQAEDLNVCQDCKT